MPIWDSRHTANAANNRETRRTSRNGRIPLRFWVSFQCERSASERITSRCAVTRPRSAAALQNSHFHNGACRFRYFSERALRDLVTLVFTKCQNKMPASFRLSGEHGLDRTARTGVR